MTEVTPFSSQNFGDTESIGDQENEFEERTLELSHSHNINGGLPNLGGVSHMVGESVQGQPVLPGQGQGALPGLQSEGGTLPGLDGGHYVGETDDDVEREVDLPSMQANSQENDEDNEYEDADDNDEDDEEGNDDNNDDDDDDVATGRPGGLYDPSEYDHLPVDQDVKDLFVNILKYTPQTVDLDTKFRPFVPDYIPAVGDIDAFIRVPRPDDKHEPLGLNVLDEPAATQSDPNVLQLQLRVLSKKSARSTVTVKRVFGGGESGGKEVDKWIKDIRDLHRSKPNPSVQYSRTMPDIDPLMQEWSGDFEDSLQDYSMPTAELDVDIASQVDIMCSLLDIPVYKSRIQSLHVLFTLFTAVRSNQLMRDYAGDTENPEYYQSADVLQL